MSINFHLLTIILLIIVDIMFIIRSIVLRELSFVTATLLLTLATVGRIITFNIANNANL
jgi:hypothetical protein